MMRTYSELIKLPTFEERFRYLKLEGTVGATTFGSKRYINQNFYTSEEWKHVRDIVIVRDFGCDLGIDGLDIMGPIQVHHMNPMMIENILHCDSDILNPEYLISTSIRTHKAIHYSNENMAPLQPVERKPNDMCPWKL